jgi:hypothetical protein
MGTYTAVRMSYQQKIAKLFEKRHVWTVFVLVLYLFTRLINITKLPVFADEAIYIRWAQVAVQEPQKYLFLSMLDGKPPLHIWLLMPFSHMTDPVLAGRLFSVFVGLGILFLLTLFVRELGFSDRSRRFTQLLYCILPYWIFLERLSVAEPLMALWLLGMIYSATVLLLREKLSKRHALIFVLSFACALLTKTTAFFFIPIVPVFLLGILFVKKKNTEWVKTIQKTLPVVFLSGFAGGLIFLLLKLSPLFPSLFSRSVDYTFTLSDILGGEWKYILFTSTPRVLRWIVWYITPFSLLALFFSGWMGAALLLSAATYAAPLLILGRVLTTRYFFPLLIFVTPAIALGLDQLLKSSAQKFGKQLFFFLCLSSSVFIALISIEPYKFPYVEEDTKQYVTDWSSGYGIPQVRSFILDEIAHGKTPYIATEGYFGTLPDGLQIYFAQKKYAGKVIIEGIGQPVTEIPKKLREKARDQDVYVVVNEHRFFDTNMEHFELVEAYLRPYGGPLLLLLRVLPEKQ